PPYTSRHHRPLTAFPTRPSSDLRRVPAKRTSRRRPAPRRPSRSRVRDREYLRPVPTFIRHESRNKCNNAQQQSDRLREITRSGEERSTILVRRSHRRLAGVPDTSALTGRTGPGRVAGVGRTADRATGAGGASASYFTTLTNLPGTTITLRGSWPSSSAAIFSSAS